MGERTQYTPGTFCWSELSTTDLDGAKAFYAALFGWEPVDNPVPGDGVYSMQNIGGKLVAAIARQPEQQRAAGVPALWNSYVSVESADATAEKARELGASVHALPFDVMDVGRMAVIQDPQGAFFMLWQPRAHGQHRRRERELPELRVQARDHRCRRELGSRRFPLERACGRRTRGAPLGPCAHVL